MILLFILQQATVRSEINIGNSLEWLCAGSYGVVTGTIRDVTPCLKGNASVCKFDVMSCLKGDTVKSITFLISGLTSDTLEAWKKSKSEILVFLNKRKEVFICNQQQAVYEVPESYNSIPAIVNLSNPQPVLLSAYNFALIRHKYLILLLCRQAIGQIMTLNGKEGGAQAYFLEVPYNTDAWELLYSGSSCYLNVPDVLFPQSRKSLF